MLSSLLGAIALGASFAAFLPLIITNSVKRVNGTGPGFLVTWLLADAVRSAASSKFSYIRRAH